MVAELLVISSKNLSVFCFFFPKRSCEIESRTQKYSRSWASACWKSGTNRKPETPRRPWSSLGSGIHRFILAARRKKKIKRHQQNVSNAELPCLTFSFTPTAFIRGHRTSNQMLVWEPEGISTQLQLLRVPSSTRHTLCFHFLCPFSFISSPYGLFSSVLLPCCNSASRLSSRTSPSVFTLVDWQLGTKKEKAKLAQRNVGELLDAEKMSSCLPTFFRYPALTFGAEMVFSLDAS